MVIIASGIARTTTTTESRKMAAILQNRSSKTCSLGVQLACENSRTRNAARAENEEGPLFSQVRVQRISCVKVNYKTVNSGEKWLICWPILKIDWFSLHNFCWKFLTKQFTLK